MMLLSRTLAIMIVLTALAASPAPSIALGQFTIPTVDDARAAAAGIHKLPGKRLTLYTDLSGPEIDVLPTVFEQAFSQWCAYFGVKESEQAAWHMTGVLMKDKARFMEIGLLPKGLPAFAHGYSVGSTLWLNEQPSDYYRRHLLIHEGVHGFMFSVLGSCGPYWYMEGMAEFLATHRWRDGRLTLGYMPEDRDEVPEWGRIRIIQDLVAKRKAMRFKAVIESPSTGMDDNESYAWRWAAVTLLDGHPRYQERFRQLGKYVKEPDFNQRFYKLFEADWQPLCEEWQLMVAHLEYGYDVVRCAVDFTPGKPLQASESSSVASAGVSIAADRGWQNTGLRLEAGSTYELTATGRCQVAKGMRHLQEHRPSALRSDDASSADHGNNETKTLDSKIWWSEPGGVTIRYYRGRPLGILLAAVRPDHPEPDSTTTLLHPFVIGLGATLSPKQTGTLFLKVNDSPGELDDNSGEYRVEIRQSFE